MMPRELVATWQDAMDARVAGDFIRTGKATRELIMATELAAIDINKLLHWTAAPTEPLPINPGEQLPQAVVDGIADTILSEPEALPWPGGVHQTGVEQ